MSHQYQKISDCINYYQNYQLTKHKYQWRAKHSKFFDDWALSDLKGVTKPVTLDTANNGSNIGIKDVPKNNEVLSR